MNKQVKISFFKLTYIVSLVLGLLIRQIYTERTEEAYFVSVLIRLKFEKFSRNFIAKKLDETVQYFICGLCVSVYFRQI